MSDRRSSVSHARSYEEMAEFWETHDTADHWDQFEEVELEVEATGTRFMSILDEIREGVRKLPAPQQQEVLDFVRFLLARADRTTPPSEEADGSGNGMQEGYVVSALGTGLVSYAVISSEWQILSQAVVKDE